MAEERAKRAHGGPAFKGRGARSNRAGRFERFETEPFDDGWNGLDEAPAPLRTQIQPDASRTVIARNSSPDLGFDRSINPYRGCEHGCVYCFARPSHAYLGLSPGRDFESRIFAKHDAAELLSRELRRPGYRCRLMALGTNTDPYQPVERRLAITRGILTVLAAHDHPVGIVTKSALVTRDIDILKPMAARGLAAVFLSITTLDRALARRLEPRAAAPVRRLEAIGALREAGIPVGVMVAPVIPALTDAELEAILAAAAEAGATRAGYIVLRLPLEIADLFQEWLARHAPNKARRVLAQMREMRGGRLYDSAFGQRQTGTGASAELLAKRFDLALRRHRLMAGSPRLDSTQFRLSPARGDQLKLL